MQSPGFWDDQQKAAATSAKHSRATRRLESYRGLESDIGDVEELAELAADDDSIARRAGRAARVDRDAGCPSWRSSACSAAATTPTTRS